MDPLVVSALYKFVSLPDYAELRAPLLAVCNQHGVKGSLLLAAEGINGTIAGTPAGIAAVETYVLSDARFRGLELKHSSAATPIFGRMKIKLKREIVTMGLPGTDPTEHVGIYVPPEEWNALLADPDLLLLDTRNTYEMRIGTFRGAKDPQLRHFRDFPAWLRSELAGVENPKVAMFCTGGIRCEKATSFLVAKGIKEVYHLKGGILAYLEVIPETDSLWEGECFVFDERVAIGHGLRPGSYELCRACREPINAADKASPAYVFGISCPYCNTHTTDEQREHFAERLKQVSLAQARGTTHLKVLGGL
jgi:UPF0176 protein